MPYKDILRKKGMKATPARVAILAFLERQKKPVTVEQIISGVPDVEQATAYRTISSLVESHLVRRIELQRDQAYYEIEGEEDHHHIVCTYCGRIEDFVWKDEKKSLISAVKQVSVFHEVHRHSLELFGICVKCEKKNSKNVN